MGRGAVAVEASGPSYWLESGKPQSCRVHCQWSVSMTSAALLDAYDTFPSHACRFLSGDSVTRRRFW